MKPASAEEFHFQFNSPLGLIAIFYTDDPFMLTRVVLPRMRAPAEGIAGRLPLLQPGERFAGRVNHFLDAYFKKQPAPVPWDILQLDGFTPLQRLVWRETAQIPFGGLSSYGRVAAAIGRPKAARFVGTALGKNPFPIFIPCHRVIRGDGGMGGFGSGLPLKDALLSHEGGGLSCGNPFYMVF